MGRYLKRLWVVALPFGVALLYSGILGKLFAGATDAEGPAWDASNAKTLNHAAAGGIAVAATFSLLVMMSVTGAVFACVVALRRMGTRVFLAYAAIGIVTYAAALWVTFECSAPYIEDLGKSTFCATVGRYYEVTGNKETSADPTSKMSHLDCKRAAWTNPQVLANVEARLAPLTSTIELSAYASVLVLVAVALCCAGLSVLPGEPEMNYVPKAADMPDDSLKLDAKSRAALNVAAQDLADRIRYLKYLAFMAAAVLGSGVAYLKSWAEWPLAFWPVAKPATAPPFIDAYQTIASALVNYEALFFVAVMLAVFGPFALILSRRGRHLARLDPELTDAPDKKNEWLMDHGLALTTADQIQRAIVFISPLLAAPIAELFKNLVTLLKV